ncbi:MAG: cytochrome c3 family protein [Anaeromyxobacteraceae bacterium]|nr:cytochrome c3 family protein [Anaeromyxobacteraceae bacterium]
MAREHEEQGTAARRAAGGTLKLALAALLLAGAGCATVMGALGLRKGPPPPPWVAYPEAQVAGVQDPHLYLGQPLCQRCHTGSDGALRAKDATALCKECHPQRHGNHPVDIVHRSPSKDLPYGEGNRIVCLTCHDPHQLRFQKKGLRLAFNDLCMKCHMQH